MKYLNILAFAFVATPLLSCNTQNKQADFDSDKPKAISIVNIPSTDTTVALMEEDDFWKIIDDSRKASANNYQTQITSLTQSLTALDPIEIIKFENRFNALLAASYDYKLWGASYVINGGCSDDCFEYFREYLIAHGKNKFYETSKDPESCVSWIKSEQEDNWEGIRYSASEAYKQKTGKDIPNTYQAKYELKGKPFDENTLDKQYPKLAKKFLGAKHNDE